MLLNQTFALADFLSLKLFFGIELSDRRRCWFSNGVDFHKDLISENLRFREDDLWIQPGNLKKGRAMSEDDLYSLGMSGLTSVLENDSQTNASSAHFG